MENFLDWIPNIASYLGNLGLIIYLFATRQNRSAQVEKTNAETRKISVGAEIELNKQALAIVSSMQLEISRLQKVIDDLGVRVRSLETERADKDKIIMELKGKIATLFTKCPKCHYEI